MTTTTKEAVTFTRDDLEREARTANQAKRCPCGRAIHLHDWCLRIHDTERPVLLVSGQCNSSCPGTLTTVEV